MTLIRTGDPFTIESKFTSTTAPRNLSLVVVLCVEDICEMEERRREGWQRKLQLVECEYMQVRDYCLVLVVVFPFWTLLFSPFGIKIAISLLSKYINNVMWLIK